MNKTQSESLQAVTTSTQASVMARRRMILASLGKGAAVASAVAVPMHSLAAIGTLSVTEGAGGKRCTISGTMSGVHSRETIKETCWGKSPSSYYNDVNAWPTSGQTFTKESRFRDVFGSGSNNKLKNCTGDERHWVTALLNGTPRSTAQNFPYSSQEVIAFYMAGNPTQSSALAFFKDYMETHN